MEQRSTPRRSVDGFLPPDRSPRPARSAMRKPITPLSASRPSRQQPSQPRAPRASAANPPSHHASSSPQLHANPKPSTAPPSLPAKHRSNRKRSKKLTSSVLKVLGFTTIFVLGFFIRVAAVGQILLFLYAAAALIFRIESRTTFTLAAMSLGVVLIAGIRSDPELMHSFALYAFLLLIIGTISLAREIRDDI